MRAWSFTDHWLLGIERNPKWGQLEAPWLDAVRWDGLGVESIQALSEKQSGSRIYLEIHVALMPHGFGPCEMIRLCELIAAGGRMLPTDTSMGCLVSIEMLPPISEGRWLRPIRLQDAAAILSWQPGKAVDRRDAFRLKRERIRLAQLHPVSDPELSRLLLPRSASRR